MNDQADTLRRQMGFHLLELQPGDLEQAPRIMVLLDFCRSQPGSPLVFEAVAKLAASLGTKCETISLDISRNAKELTGILRAFWKPHCLLLLCTSAPSSQSVARWLQTGFPRIIVIPPDLSAQEEAASVLRYPSGRAGTSPVGVLVNFVTQAHQAVTSFRQFQAVMQEAKSEKDLTCSLTYLGFVQNPVMKSKSLLNWWKGRNTGQDVQWMAKQFGHWTSELERASLDPVTELGSLLQDGVLRWQ